MKRAKDREPRAEGPVVVLGACLVGLFALGWLAGLVVLVVDAVARALGGGA